MSNKTTNETAVAISEKKKSAAVAKLMNLYATRAVEQKDFTLKEAFQIGCKAAAPYVQEDGSLLLPVIGFASKFVAKYAKDGCAGYHTMIYLADGKKMGAFSNALLRHAEFFYLGTGTTLSDYARIDFDAPIDIRVTLETFDTDDHKGGTVEATSYGFDIVGGEATSVRTLGSVEQYTNLIDTVSALDALPEKSVTAE